jgi:hypothetical protein
MSQCTGCGGMPPEGGKGEDDHFGGEYAYLVENPTIDRHGRLVVLQPTDEPDGPVSHAAT